MRRQHAFLLIILFGIIGILTYELFTPITLLFEDPSRDAINPTDIPPIDSNRVDPKRLVIPKILHQTYKNETIPDVWKEAHSSCKQLHSDYEYKFWTDESAREFIKTEYPWFLDTFDSYPYNIMRADTIRYFILNHYGGVYLDLDVGCRRKLDPLLTYPAFVRKTKPTGISNNVMGSIPKHPFFLRAMETLKDHNINWHVHYLTVMASTGPLFLSIIFQQYLRGELAENDRVRIMMPDEYKGKAWSFFEEYQGSSWHKNDGSTFLWMGKHWLIVTIFGFAVGLTLLYLIARATGGGRNNGDRKGYLRLLPWRRGSSSSEPDKWKV